MKKCSNCFKEKPLTDFYTRQCADGYQSRCKKCNYEVSYGYVKRKREVMMQKYDEIIKQNLESANG